MSAARHRWVPEVSRAKWQRVDVCAKCGTRRWLISFPNRANQTRQAFLFQAQNQDARWGRLWSEFNTDCAAQAPRADSPKETP